MTPRQDPTAAARNEAFFADNAAYTERVASLDTYRFIREHLDAEVAGAQRLLDIGNGGTFDYDPALAGAITAVDLFVEPGAERPPNVEYVQGDALDPAGRGRQLRHGADGDALPSSGRGLGPRPARGTSARRWRRRTAHSPRGDA